MGEPTQIIVFHFIRIGVEVIQIELCAPCSHLGLPQLLFLLSEVAKTHLVFLGKFSRSIAATDALVNEHVVLAAGLELSNQLGPLSAVSLGLLRGAMLLKGIHQLLLLRCATFSTFTEVSELLSSLALDLV